MEGERERYKTAWGNVCITESMNTITEMSTEFTSCCQDNQLHTDRLIIICAGGAITAAHTSSGKEA